MYSTKDRAALINPSVEEKIHIYQKDQLIELGCPVRIINGMHDHMHLLFLQNPKISIVDILKQVKGSTSHWINDQNLISQKFGWQTGYAAYSVSESQLEKVYNYILKQKEHHQQKTFLQEYQDFISPHGLKFEE